MPVVMVVAASATLTVLMVVMVMAVLMIVRMAMTMIMMVVLMVMAVAVVVMPVAVMMVVVVADMGAALRLEGTLHRSDGAALAARQLREGRIVLDVQGVARDLGKPVVGAEVPGKAHEAQGVLSAHLQQGLGLRLHLDEAAVLQAQGVAVVDGGLHVEIEKDLGAALGRQLGLPAAPRLMIEGHRVDDTVGLHGGLADDGGDAGHGFVSGELLRSGLDRKRNRPR